MWNLLLHMVFWGSLLLLFHTYAGYPVILLLVRQLNGRTRKSVESGGEPTVSIVVSVYNERGRILNRIENLRSSRYPAERLEILVGSDGSDDGTNEALSGSDSAGIRTRLFPTRRGKAAVLNDLVKEAGGEILIFTDANTMFEPETVARLAGRFTDPTVGAVCGELILATRRPAAGSDGEATYWGYENRLKQLESDLGSSLGASGAVYAMRRELYTDLPTDKPVVDDFLVPLGVIRRGYRVEYTRDAKAYEESAGSVAREFRRKVRIGRANFFTLGEIADLLNPQHGFVAFALWSHKLIRWFAPLILLLLIVALILLRDQGALYRIFFSAGIACMALSLVGFAGDTFRIRLSVLSWPYYFVAMNSALLVGMVQFLMDRRKPHWDVVR